MRAPHPGECRVHHGIAVLEVVADQRHACPGATMRSIAQTCRISGRRWNAVWIPRADYLPRGSQHIRSGTMARPDPLLGREQFVGADYGVAGNLQPRRKFARRWQPAACSYAPLANSRPDCTCELLVSRTFAIELQIHESKLVLSGAAKV